MSTTLHANTRNNISITAHTLFWYDMDKHMSPGFCFLRFVEYRMYLIMVLLSIASGEHLCQFIT